MGDLEDKMGRHGGREGQECGMSIKHYGMRLTYIPLLYELKQTLTATFLCYLQLNTRYRGSAPTLGLSSELRSVLAIL